jgi:hypothetical protein
VDLAWFGVNLHDTGRHSAANLAIFCQSILQVFVAAVAWDNGPQLAHCLMDIKNYRTLIDYRLLSTLPTRLGRAGQSKQCQMGIQCI